MCKTEVKSLPRGTYSVALILESDLWNERLNLYKSWCLFREFDWDFNGEGTCSLQVVYTILNEFQNITTPLSYFYMFSRILYEALCSSCSITISGEWRLAEVSFSTMYKSWSVAFKDALRCTLWLKCIAPAVHWSCLAQKGVVIDLLLKSGLPHGFFQGIISMSLGWQDMKLRVFLKFSFTPRGVYLSCGNRGYTLFSPCVQCRMTYCSI